MSIERFLQDFEGQKNRREKDYPAYLNSKEEQEAQRQKFLLEFHQFYIEQIFPDLKNISGKLEPKFSLSFEEEPVSSLGFNIYLLQVIPNSKHFIKRLEIEIRADSREKVVSISGVSFGEDDKRLRNKKPSRFSQENGEIKDIEIENEIVSLLDHFFLVK